MTEDEALVWYEADGTRHVLGGPRPAPIRTPPEPDPESADPAEPSAPAPPVEPPSPKRLVEWAAPEATRAAAPARPVEPTEATPLVDEPPTSAAPGDTSAASDAGSGEAQGAERPSAMGGMARALLLGAAAAAATGAVVGAISLAATGDRPDTVAPTTVATESDPATTGSPPATVETIELAPSTTSADQPE